MSGRTKDYSFLYLLLILIIIVLAILLFKRKDSFQINKQICIDYVQSSLNGVVDSCFFNYQNKGTFTFKLKDSELFYTFPFAVISHPENYLHIGDSIVKIKGESKYNIYKDSNPDSLIVLSFDCSYWDKK